MNILTNYDFRQNQIMNVVVHKLAVAPSNPIEGQIYYDTVKKRQFSWNGTVWVGADSADAQALTATQIVELINGSTSIIDNNNLSTEVNDAIGKRHAQNSDTGTSNASFTVGTSGFMLKNVTSVLNVRNVADTAYASIVASNITSNGNLIVTGNLTLGTGNNTHLIKSSKTTIQTYGKKTDAGAALTNVFEVIDGNATPNNLFEVRQNGDTVIGGVLTVNGTGGSSFAGNVNIGGALSVQDGIVGGTTMQLGEDLIVKGNTILGDNAVVDKTTMYGTTTVHSGTTKASSIALVNTWKTNNPAHTPEQLRAYVSSLPDVFAVVDGSEVKTAEGVVTTPAVPLLQVKGNGDTIFAGILTVNGDGESFFSGDVRIGGDASVEGGLTVLGDATVQAILTQNNMTITGNLFVEGITNLGNDASTDSTNIFGVTTIKTSTNKATIDGLVATYTTANPLATKEEIDAYKATLVAQGYIDVFAVKDSTNANLFQVKGNGDTVIGGVLTVNGSGTSSFSGDVSIGGALTVTDGVVGGTTMNLGEDLTVQGKLVVNGNTILGDNALVDTITIKGVTTISSAVTKAAGNSNDLIFKVVDSINSPLLSVATNGDTVIGGSLTVTENATIIAALSGDNLTLSGNLVVNGNTTLGNASTDTLNVVGVVTLPSTITIGSLSYSDLAAASSGNHAQNTDTGTSSNTFTVGTSGIKLKNISGTEAQIRNTGDTDYADLRVKNLFVEGATTTITSNTVSIGDSELELNSDITMSATNSDGGISVKRLKSDNVTRADAKLTYNNSINRWQSTQGVVSSPLVTAVVPNKVVTVIGDGLATSYIITHNLNTRDLSIGIRTTASPYETVITDVEATTLNTITVKFAVAPLANEYTVTVIG